MEKRIIKTLWYFIIIILSLISCQSDNNCNDLRSLKYGACNNTKVQKQINGYLFSVFYVPENESKIQADKRQKYAHFCLRIDPDTANGKKFDIVTDRAQDVKNLMERIEKLNFSFERNVEMKIDTNSYLPFASNLENTYSIEQGRLVHLYFLDNGILSDINYKEDKDVQITWEDGIYGTGKNIFAIPFNEIKILHNKVNEFYENAQKIH